MRLILFNPWINFKNDKKFNFKLKSNDIFLGDWCLRNYNFTENSKFKTLFGTILGFDKNKNKKFIFPYRVYDKILKNLCKSLNLYHKKEENDSYWEFILNTWLWVFLDTLQSRWQMIKQLNKDHFKEILTLDTNDETLKTVSSEHLKELSSSSILWNIALINKIISLENFKKVKRFKYKKNYESNYIYRKKKLDLIYNNKAILNYSNFNKINKFNKKIFLYNLTLPNNLKVSYLLKNLQIPCPSKNEKKKIDLKNDQVIRNEWKKCYKFNVSPNKFLNLANKLIPITLPRIFLDKFRTIKNIPKNLNWPKKPKIILSSYGHYIDEIFKVYASNLISNGTKYFIFQHGAAGIYKEHVAQFFEEKLSFKYLTWGWKKNNKNIPMFVNTCPQLNRNYENQKVRNKILFSIYHFPIFPQRSAFGYSYKFSINNYYADYLTKFLNGLNKDSIKKIFVKNYKLYEPCVQERIIKKKFKHIKFINTDKFSYQINHKFDLTIETYMSTGFFESMMLNSPVILLFNKNLINTNESFTKWIKKLKLCKICFDDLGEANYFINNKFKNLNKWWNGKNLQKIRLEFCNNFARSPKKFSNNLYKFVK